MSRLHLTIFLFFLLLQSIVFSQDIRDLIQPVRLTAGQNDTVLISDVFYSGRYDLKITGNDTVNAEYFSESGKVIFKPSENFRGINLVHFSLGKKNYSIPLISKENFKKSFYFKTSDKPAHVNLFGSFNGWDRQAQPMTEDSNGVYQTTIFIEPGRYEYKFFVDGKEVVDPANPEKVPNGMGDYNSILTIKSPDSSKTFLHKQNLVEKNGSIIISFELLPASNSQQQSVLTINKKDVAALIDNEQISADAVAIKDNLISITLNKELLHGYKVIRAAVNKNGGSSNIQSVFLKDGKPVDAADTHFDQSKIIYSLMIDRFFDGDPANSIPIVHDSLFDKANYMGGDLKGVIDKIDEGYFNSLGVNTIWVSPVIQNTDSAYRESPAPHRWFTGYHGYWPVSPVNVEERFGSMQLFKNLVDDAHNKGIKILLDYVAHHVHIEHPYWKEHRDWFGALDLPDGRKNLRLWDEQRLTTWFEPYMPSFDYTRSKAALDTMTDNAVWWLKQTSIDGFRHDAVKHVPNEFWRLLTKKIKSDPELTNGRSIYQIGETFGSYDLISSYVNNGQLNAQFNFNLYDTAIPVFIEKNISFSALDDQMQKTFAVYGVNHSMGNIMDSHDKVRFMAYADGDVSMSSGNPVETGWTNPPKVDDRRNYDKLKLYMAYMLSIPGLPVIYYGDEFGMTGAADPDNRRMMRFGKDLSIWEQQTLIDVKKIINLRKNHSALKFGDFLTLTADKDVYAYLRSDFNEKVLIVLNKGTSASLKFSLPAALNGKSAVDLMTGDKFLINNNNLYLNIPSEGYKFFVIQSL